MSKKVKIETDNKRYREDIGLWEEKIRFLWIFYYYKYSIWGEIIPGQLWERITFFKKKKKQAKYFEFTPLPPITIGKQELKDRYQNNKWNVPINIIYDENRP